MYKKLLNRNTLPKKFISKILKKIIKFLYFFFCITKYILYLQILTKIQFYMKRLTFTLLLIVLSTSIILAQSLTSASRADHSSRKTYQPSSSTEKTITGGITCTTPAYIAGSTQTLDFTLTVASPDYEYIDGVSMTFPAGMTPQTTGTSSPLAPNNGCSGVDMNLAPISGQTVVWGQVTTFSQCGPTVAGTYPFQVSVIIGAGVTGPQAISFYIMGDGYGSTPHTISGTITINPAQTSDVGVASIPMASNYLPGATVTPSAIVQNFGTAPQNFTVNMAINDGTTDVYTDSYSVSNLAAGATETVNFTNWTAVAGLTYTATATTVLAGDANPSNDSQSKTFTVANITDAYTGNTTDLVYHSISLDNGILTNVGAIGSDPFPMAETYDGNTIYRVYSNMTIGTVSTTGVYTSLGTMTGVPGTPTGIAWDFSTSTMYVLVLQQTTNLPMLCALNLSNYSLTLIGTGAEGMIIGIDVADDGFIYGPSLNPDNLYKIDPATGAVTSMGPVGIDLNYGQDVAYDKATQKLFTITCGAAYKFGYYNLANGAFTEIADMNGKQHATFVIMNTSGPAEDDDVMVESITAIDAGCNLSATETIEIVVKNVGNVAQSNIPVYYTINGGAQVSGTVAGPIAPGTSESYTFTTTADLSAPGSYSIQACTDLSGDANNANDCKTISTTSIASSTIPYSMGFEPGEDYSNWKIENLNSDGSFWYIDEYTDLAHTGDWFAVYEYNPLMNANDWLITTCIDLDENETYKLSFWTVVGEWSGTVYPEKMKVAFGTAPTSTAMTNVIVDLPNMNHTTYQETVANFTVPSTGTYYIGFHAYSDADMFYIALDDIMIDISTGIQTNIINNITIFPNPAQDIIQVISNENINKIEVYTTTGQLVYMTSVDELQHRLNVSSFADGLYFIKVITSTGTSTKQIMIAK